MPTFAIHCIDKPLQRELRMATRPEHLLYLEAAIEHVLVAGPLLDDEGLPIGSMLLMNFPDRKAAVAFAAADPYALAGLFSSVAVTAWRQVSSRARSFAIAAFSSSSPCAGSKKICRSSARSLDSG